MPGLQRGVRFHPDARIELLEAEDWYLQRSAAAASEFVREVEHALARIVDAPERYPKTRFGQRRFVLLQFPFDLVYRIAETELEIIALAHHSRRPGYWRTR